MINFNESLLKKKDQAEMKCIIISDDDIELFVDLLAANSRVRTIADSCVSASNFYKSYPDMKKIFGSKADEVFYAYKNGYYYSGALNKISYYLRLAIDSCEVEAPNLVISVCLSKIKSYANKVFKTSETSYDTYDIINTVFGYKVNLLTPANVKVQNGSFYEVWIPDVKRVALLPKDIYDMLSYEDCKKLEFDAEKGIVLGNMPLRIFNRRMGITLSDFDLRECI